MRMLRWMCGVTKDEMRRLRWICGVTKKDEEAELDVWSHEER